jgi:type IV pilus assembly protein PilA
LLIVVAIILIIAAIAIPNLMRARIASNESAAASQLRTLNTAG